MGQRQGSLETVGLNPNFWQAKKVLVTGHTGFKGSWLSLWLQKLGAELVGYALSPPTAPSLFEVADVGAGMTSILGDVRDLERLVGTLEREKPEIVFHLSAQALLRPSARDAGSSSHLGTANRSSVLPPNGPRRQSRRPEPAMRSAAETGRPTGLSATSSRPSGPADP